MAKDKLRVVLPAARLEVSHQGYETDPELELAGVWDIAADLARTRRRNGM